jgi:uncharacterized heparinase superfamily protein
VNRAPSQVAPDRFVFLNESHTLTGDGWDNPALPRLWRYNLHYFDDLSAPATDERAGWQRDLLRRWVRENREGIGTAWEPYPTSLRIVNWIKWALRGNALPEECIQSLATQARWLSRRLERHLLGNHLFANAKALVFAGCFFDGPQAHAWLTRGLEILARELPEQILPDGGHFERSPMYHAIALEDMLDLVNMVVASSVAMPAGRRHGVDEWRIVIMAMRRWLAAMCHPDGDLSFFNDATLGVSATAAELDAYASRLGLGSVPLEKTPVIQLSQSGYVRVSRPELVAILDVAEIGPDYLPAHGHADTLSFEASLFGQRVFVNSGVSQYASGSERLRQRGTAAHNTVIVDGQDSSEVWAEFRVARRARPVDLVIDDAGPIRVSCAHSGYSRLPGRPRHARTWTISRDALQIEDRVIGECRTAIARFHLHPAVVIDDSRDNRVGLRLPDGKRIVFEVVHGHLGRKTAQWHPGFGQSIPTSVIVVTLDAARAVCRVNWQATS